MISIISNIIVLIGIVFGILFLIGLILFTFAALTVASETMHENERLKEENEQLKESIQNNKDGGNYVNKI